MSKKFYDSIGAGGGGTLPEIYGVRNSAAGGPLKEQSDEVPSSFGIPLDNYSIADIKAIMDYYQELADSYKQAYPEKYLENMEKVNYYDNLFMIKADFLKRKSGI